MRYLILSVNEETQAVEMQLHNEGVLLKFDFELYKQICRDNNLPQIKGLPEGIVKYQIDKDGFMPCYAMDANNNVYTLDKVGIDPLSIDYLYGFNQNFRTICKAVHYPQGEEFYPIKQYNHPEKKTDFFSKNNKKTNYETPVVDLGCLTCNIL